MKVSSALKASSMSRERNVVVLASRAAEMSDNAQKSLQNAAIAINAAAVELRQCAHACDKIVKVVEFEAEEAGEEQELVFPLPTSQGFLCCKRRRTY